MVTEIDLNPADQYGISGGLGRCMSGDDLEQMGGDITVAWKPAWENAAEERKQQNIGEAASAYGDDAYTWGLTRGLDWYSRFCDRDRRSSKKVDAER
mgnify:CR=1 FL=1